MRTMIEGFFCARLKTRRQIPGLVRFMQRKEIAACGATLDDQLAAPLVPIAHIMP